MSGYKNIDPEVGKATQFPHNDPTKGGSRGSIKKQLRDALSSDGTVTFKPDQIKETLEDGSVVIQLTTSEEMAHRLIDWAMCNKGSDSLKAIQMIMEQVDGKPKQTISAQVNTEPKFIIIDEGDESDESTT